MTDLPRPPIPAGVDLRDFHFMPLDIIKLSNSETWMTACTVPFAAAACINIWCKAWHQVPAGSLPDNEAMHRICVAVPNWDEVRDIALRGFVKCSDGRLYHQTIVDAAKKAWKEKTRYKKAAKLRWKNKKQGNATHKRRKPENPCVASKMDDAKPHASHMQERGTGRGKQDSVSNETGEPPKAVDPVKVVYDTGKDLLKRYGKSDNAAGALITKWLKKATTDELLSALVRAGSAERADIVAFIEGCLKADTTGQVDPGHEEAAEHWRLKHFLKTGDWRGNAGEEPEPEAAQKRLAALSGVALSDMPPIPKRMRVPPEPAA